jgi:hypothetical protein
MSSRNVRNTGNENEWIDDGGGTLAPDSGASDREPEGSAWLAAVGFVSRARFRMRVGRVALRENERMDYAERFLTRNSRPI